MIWEITIIVFLMLVAIVLILLEIFLLPGITIAGVGGFLFAASGVIYAYTVGETAGHITLIPVVNSLCRLICMVNYVPGHSTRSPLKTDVDSKLTSSRDLGIEPGDEGITLSRLAPIGKARIKGITVEAKSMDELIDENTPVEVLRVDGYNVLVKRKEQTDIHA